MDGITREVGQDGRSAWRAVLRRRGRTLQMRFPDATFGGSEQALVVARAWRDAVMATVPTLQSDGEAAASTDPVDGSRPGLARWEARGPRAARWSARMTALDGRIRVRTFSVARHGEAEAKAKAERGLDTELQALETPAAPDAPPAGPSGPPPETRTPAAPGQYHDEPFYSLCPAVGPRGHRQWRVAFTRGGRLVQAGFPHLTYGGDAPALAVARAWRDAALAVLPPLSNIAMRQIVRRNRREGMPGVLRVEDPRNGAAAWIAIISLPDGRSLRRSFAVKRYGEAEARARAEAERLRMLEALESGHDPALRSPAALAHAKGRLAAEDGST